MTREEAFKVLELLIDFPRIGSDDMYDPREDLIRIACRTLVKEKNKQDSRDKKGEENE